ncbi:MAG: metallophosphoesterase family protein [Deinococcota bacterium]
MRHLILSDIHANNIALEAVITHAGEQTWDNCVFLGDLVGYYPQPEAAATSLRALNPSTCILGNHDAMLIDLARGKPLDPSQGSNTVQAILERQLQDVSDNTLDLLSSFKRHAIFDGWEVTHGTLREQWAYLISATEAKRNYPLMSTPLCFVGHSHIPIAYVHNEGAMFWRSVPFKAEDAHYPVPEGASVFFNPGSVGQPRDGIPLASYAIFDDATNHIELFRVAFDIAAIHALIERCDYPRALAERLEYGR